MQTPNEAYAATRARRFCPAVSGLFFAAIPVTSWLAQPNSLLEGAVERLCSSIPFLSSAGSTATVSPNGKLAALAALYISITYAVSGAGSAAAANAGVPGGRDNNHPRGQLQLLRGLPLRLYSAHNHLVEMFPGWAVTAALAQSGNVKIAFIDPLLWNLPRGPREHAESKLEMHGMEEGPGAAWWLLGCCTTGSQHRKAKTAAAEECGDWTVDTPAASPETAA